MTPPPASSRTGADRWMVSYADLVTLLFAFFTTLYAASSIDSSKMAPVASSLQEAFAVPPAGTAHDKTGTSTSADVGLHAPAPAPAEEDLHQRLKRLLAGAIDEGRLELIRDPRGLVVSLPDDATFPVGSADATAQAKALIATVGDAVKSSSNAIRIEGHTDNVPIRTPKFDSNWELSTARASAVVAYLVTRVGIEASRLSAAGYGEFHPRGPNVTAADRARNRRVDLVILDSHDPMDRRAPTTDTATAQTNDAQRAGGEVDARP
jgi:chemotaxis protein MotB